MKFEITFNIDVNSCLSIDILDLKSQKVKNYKLIDQFSKNYEKKIMEILENKNKKKKRNVNEK